MKSPIRILGFILLAAVLTRLPMIDSAFRADDFLIYRASGDWLRELGERGLRCDPTDHIPTMHRGNFRPVTWFSHVIELGVQDFPGEIVAHLFSLVIHLLGVVILFLILLRLGDIRAAALAALLFGCHPAGIQAFSWISGRSDLFLPLFLGLSFRFSLEARRSTDFAAGLCAALAVGSKVTSLAALPFLLAFFLWQRRRSWISSLFLWSLPLLGIFYLRYIWLGTPGPYYYMHAQENAELELELGIGQRVIAVFRFLAEMIAPSARGDSGHETWLRRLGGTGGTTIAVALVVAVPLLRLVLVPERRAVAVGLLAFALASLPLISIFNDSCVGLETSRNYNLPFFVYAAVHAMALVDLLRRGGVLRVAGITSLILLLLVAVDSLVAYARLDAEVTRRVRARCASIEEILSRTAAPTAIVCLDDEKTYCGQLLMESAYAWRFLPPFHEEVRVVQSSARSVYLPCTIAAITEPLVVATWQPEREDFEITQRHAGVISRESLQLASRIENGRLILTPTDHLESRSLATLLVPISSSPGGTLLVTLVHEEERVVLRRVIPPHVGEARIYPLSIPAESVGAGRLLRIEIDEVAGLHPSTLLPAWTGIMKDLVVPGAWSEAGFVVDRLELDFEPDLVRVVALTAVGDPPKERLQIASFEWQGHDFSRDETGRWMMTPATMTSFDPIEINREVLGRHLAQPPGWEFFWRVEFLKRDGSGVATIWFWSLLTRR